MDGTIKLIRQGDLYALLSVCTDEDLEPLAATIAEGLPDFLETDEAYRRLKPRHSIYHRLIGDALRRCGDSPEIGAVRGEGPSYDVLVADVCKKLDVPHEAGETARNESNLLTIHLGQQLSALGDEEQAAALARARAEASGKADTVLSAAREGVGSVLASAVQLRGQVTALEQGALAAVTREVSNRAATVAAKASEEANSLLARVSSLGVPLTSLVPDAQSAAIAKAREVSAKAADAASTAKDAVGAMFSRAIRPLARSASGLSLAEPMFRVTVPCVLHLAYLRRKHLERLSATAASMPVASDQLAYGDTPGVVGAGGGATLVVGASVDKPVLSLARIPEPGARVWHPVTGSEDSISRLNPLLQAVPALGAALHVSTTSYMEVVVNGPLAEAIGGGFRGWVRGAEGKIVEQARLFDASTLSTVVSAGVLFQIVSVAVAQKHLADISRKLSDIKAAVDRIQRFQSNERRSILTGAIRYFEQVAPAVLAGELSNGIRNQIEHHEAHLLQVQDHLLEDIRRESEEVLTVKDDDMLGSKGMQDAIQAHQALLDDLYRQLLLCIRARACGWQLLVVFPGEERLKEARKRSIQEAIGALRENGDLLKQTDRFVREKVRSLSSLWNRATTLNERKLALLAWNEALVAEVGACKEQVGLDIRAAEAVTSERLQPVKMLLRIEDGRAVAACAA